jgi:hypothetical protein
MADIDLVPRRRSYLWLWIVLAILLIVIIWFALAGGGGAERVGSLGTEPALQMAISTLLQGGSHLA